VSAVVESAVPATSQRPAPVAVPAPAVAVAAPVVEASPRMPARRRPPLLGRPRVQRVVYPLLVGVVLVALWQIAVTAMELPPYLVPSPLLMMQTLVTDWVPLGNALLVTLKITLLSFAVATVAGVLISFLFVQSKRIETALFPYAVLLQVTPIVAVAPLIIIWVRNPTAAMTICAALVALFPIISNTTLGLRSVDPDLQAYFRLNRATRWQQLVRLRIPSARWVSQAMAANRATPVSEISSSAANMRGMLSWKPACRIW
jgi:NitT/TauT family transport system permease protein